jgi:hypothetical protein
MADATENYSKFDVRAIVRFWQAEEVSQSEIHRRSLSVYGQKAVSRQEVSGCRN